MFLCVQGQVPFLGRCPNKPVVQNFEAEKVFTDYIILSNEVLNIVKWCICLILALC